ncbi:hypothetical protein, partial [Rahnella inusitata]|uniref:hypothetical protein n=1 Tax=Rahnella inusitata TaxID=58169 RepID=UPI0039B07B18
ILLGYKYIYIYIVNLTEPLIGGSSVTVHPFGFFLNTFPQNTKPLPIKSGVKKGSLSYLQRLQNGLG